VSQDPKQSKVQTSCKDCIFAVYEDKTQIGCEANNRLEKYRHQGRVTDAYDDDKEFSVIDSICVFCKNKDWAPEQKCLQQKYDVLRHIATIKYESIVLVGPDQTLEDIKVTVDSLANQILLPKKITLILALGNHIKMGRIHSLMNTTLVKWQAKHMLDSDIDENKAIDQALKFDKHQYYAVFRAGYFVPDWIFNALDIMVNDKLMNFTMIKADADGNGLIVPRSIHEHLGGNFEQPLIEKILELETDIDIPTYSKVFHL